jgi:L-lysine exporter family protein LysE/ArgO
MHEAMISGYLVSIGLIAAIGAQNAFVLRQGIRREHVLAVVLVCALSDALLIAVGVAGLGRAQAMWPGLERVLLWAGIAFLVVYGAQRLLAAMKGGEALRPTEGGSVPLAKVLATCLIFTWANPHVYLDTVVLIGSISAQYAPHQWAFAAAAAMGSFSFFAALGFGARLLAPVFAAPRAWVGLEIFVGLTMWAIAARLAFSA